MGIGMNYEFAPTSFHGTPRMRRVRAGGVISRAFSPLQKTYSFSLWQTNPERGRAIWVLGLVADRCRERESRSVSGNGRAASHGDMSAQTKRSPTTAVRQEQTKTGSTTSTLFESGTIFQLMAPQKTVEE